MQCCNRIVKAAGKAFGSSTMIEKDEIAMSFRDNLQHLRATRNMTQEQLAMLVGVSRQSVTKWEAEKAYPEMDKLMKLCQIFDCTLDELVQGDLTTRECDPALEMSSSAPQDVCDYDAHMRRFARRIALGVLAIIFGVGLGLFLDRALWQSLGTEEGVITLIVLFVGLIVGLVLIIPAGVGNDAFKKQHPYIQDFYSSEDKSRSMRAGAYGIAIGIALIFIGVIIVVVLKTELAAGIMLMAIALGVGLIVYSGIMMGRVDIDDYNDQVLADMSDGDAAEILGSLDEAEAARRIEKRRVNRIVGPVCGIIMLAATAIALLMLFTGFGGEDNNLLFWIPWPIGGVCCAIVGAASGLIKGHK